MLSTKLNTHYHQTTKLDNLISCILTRAQTNDRVRKRMGSICEVGVDDSHGEVRVDIMEKTVNGIRSGERWRDKREAEK